MGVMMRRDDVNQREVWKLKPRGRRRGDVRGGLDKTLIHDASWLQTTG